MTSTKTIIVKINGKEIGYYINTTDNEIIRQVAGNDRVGLYLTEEESVSTLADAKKVIRQDISFINGTAKGIKYNVLDAWYD